MDRERAGRERGSPPGEYVVRHERPYPERLDRAFRIGAAIAASAAGIGIAGTIFLAAPHIPAGLEGWVLLTLSILIAAATAYAAVRAIGLITTAIVAGLRRKAYVVDYEERS